ncbi:Spo0E like sporulation regulatory protein [Paenibacillus konkukensis]|uniref:Spo0E like sporulation regulatory protein n=2 Tax=Paenibacillus konkukensis TaxID=2020716 RepID=A0ABY4RHJ0_9BACL|nr:aspartyl-phosphate phosphatase Spo0E family protein [Paenibacillus doosanensis]UQZ81600.1 Spo0E like sporulation regulatory protein [Paenibacillus konkukensis]
MLVSAQLERKIRLCNRALEQLISVNGYELTSPDVVEKSKELDQLIVMIMRKQVEQKKSKQYRETT